MGKKGLFQKIISFKMGNLIEEYKNNKQDRKEYTPLELLKYTSRIYCKDL